METNTATDQLVTIGEIARRLAVPAARVKYVVDTRQIMPTGRIGITRVWGLADIPRIASALDSIRNRGTAAANDRRGLRQSPPAPQPMGGGEAS